MKHISLLAACLLTGCAGTAADCGPDWFATGQRDARINAGSQIERYAARCTGQVDRDRYAAGYADAFSQRPIPLW